jgi:hypothetical protein
VVDGELRISYGKPEAPILVLKPIKVADVLTESAQDGRV